MEYALPRLTRIWTHLDRQGGSGGGSGSAGAAKGEGESQLELDRRLSHQRIDKLKAELEEVRKNRETMRKERSRNAAPHAAIVGYTNAGKSSLLKRLTGADVLVENKLFATMDTTTRRLAMPDGQELLVTDTVGFVRRLPHDLVQSFRATLEEAMTADFLVHVLDASHPQAPQFFSTTMEVLRELGAGEHKMVLVLNKIDLVEDRSLISNLVSLCEHTVMMSTITGEGQDQLMHALHSMLLDRVVRLEVLLPMSRMDLVNLAHTEGKVLIEKYSEHGAWLQCVMPKRWETRYLPFLSAEPPSEEA
jgi:GTPase